ncbi:MAG: glycosyltransferase [Terriglobia bacterium]
MRHDAPIGVPQSRRHGLSVAGGDVLVWMDAHMSFAPNWLDHMMAHVDSGALLCVAWWNYELTRPLCWGADFIWRHKRDYAAGYCPGFDLRHRTAFPDGDTVEVPMVIGACYMMRRESYERIGGFSPFFRVWGKADQDLSIRSWMAGLGVRCVAGARVGHLSRRKFPYPVRWEDIEFNQLALIRTVFEKPTVQAIEEMLQPIPPDVQAWLAQIDFREFRQLVQSSRQISDAGFFRRFVPDAPECLMGETDFALHSK